MNFAQFYEILILRDIFFYILPGSITLLGLTSISWFQMDEAQRLVLKGYLPSSAVILILVFLLLSYILGQILFMLQSKTFGRTVNSRGHTARASGVCPAGVAGNRAAPRAWPVRDLRRWRASSPLAASLRP